MDMDQIDSIFSFHPADTEGKRNAHEPIRDLCRALAHEIRIEVPDCREKSLAITHLQSVMMFANSAIAQNEL